MKIQRLMALSSLSGTGMMILSGPAAADFQGLGVTLQFAPLNQITYRVYANFSSPNDYATRVYGSAADGPLVIESRNINDTAPGSSFFNPVFTHGDAPTSGEVLGGNNLTHGSPMPAIPNALWDSFYTVGVHAGGHHVGTATPAQGMPSNAFSGTSFASSNASWFTEYLPFGQAGWIGDGDPLLRVLLIQLTVSSTSNVRGTLNLVGINDTGLASGEAFTITGLTFNSNSIPGPATLSVLGMLCIGQRRRRRVNHV